MISNPGIWICLTEFTYVQTGHAMRILSAKGNTSAPYNAGPRQEHCYESVQKENKSFLFGTHTPCFSCIKWFTPYCNIMEKEFKYILHLWWVYLTLKDGNFHGIACSLIQGVCWLVINAVLWMTQMLTRADAGTIWQIQWWWWWWPRWCKSWWSPFWMETSSASRHTLEYSQDVCLPVCFQKGTWLWHDFISASFKVWICIIWNKANIFCCIRNCEQQYWDVRKGLWVSISQGNAKQQWLNLFQISFNIPLLPQLDDSDFILLKTETYKSWVVTPLPWILIWFLWSISCQSSF